MSETTSTTETITADAVSRIIYRQISGNVLMSLGAHMVGLSTIQPGTGLHLPGLTFLAKILPFRKDGTRGSTGRIMRVTISLNAHDLYDLDVRYSARRSVVGDTIHYFMTDIPAESLNTILLALDYDGPTVLNSRLAG